MIGESGDVRAEAQKRTIRTEVTRLPRWVPMLALGLLVALAAALAYRATTAPTPDGNESGQDPADSRPVG